MLIINKEICACCHNCACDCPMQAIDFVGTKYEIDQSKCVGCGLCSKVCHTGACHEEPKNAVLVQQHDPITMDCDVVVVGTGAGLVSACLAAQAGKKVIVLDKNFKIGGNTDFAHGFMVPYSKWHASIGLSDKRESSVAMFMKMSENEIEEELIRAGVYGVTDFFDWLCTLCNIEETYTIKKIDAADAHGPIAAIGSMVFQSERKYENLLCRDDAIGPGWGGTHMKHVLLEAIEKQKLDVKIYISTEAEHLILDDERKICGIIAKDSGGEVRINCKTVMLACGGFGRNDEMLKKYANFDFFGGETAIHRFSVPGDTGDGITMLQEIGVEPNPERMCVSMFGPKHHPFNNSIADIALEPVFPQININGTRWFDENEGIMRGYEKISAQPKEISYAIMQYDMIKEMAESYLVNPRFASKKQFYATWEADLEEESKLDTPVKKADTLEELAVLFGAEPRAFVAEIEKYNKFCKQGKDEDFGKNPKFLKAIPMDKGPYYAVYGQRFSEAAMGGVTINTEAQVLRNDGTIIHGLYAGGDCTSSMHRPGKLAPLSELTWAVATNYIAGSNMVAYINGNEENKEVRK